MTIRRILLAALLLSILMACGNQDRVPASPPAPATAPAPTVVFPSGWTVQVDLALAPDEQARGLMFVDYLPADKGMLFLFDTDEARPFWMKNCLISLDLVWLDTDFRVVDISRDVSPCKADPCPSVYPNRPIRNVLEVQAGLCAAKGLKVGDKLVVLGLPQASPAGTP